LFALLTVVWASGVVLLLVKLAWGWRRLGALRREFRPLDDVRVQQARRQASATLGTAATPPVVASRRAKSPLSLGILRPVIVLPEGLAESLNPQQLHDVIVHEGAHFLHHDHLLGLWQRVVQIVYWPHPLVYLLGRELDAAREEVCDDHVLQGDSALAYARTLLALSRRAGLARPVAWVIGFLSGGGRLERRVARLFDRRRHRATRITSPRLAAAAVALLAFAAAAGGVRLVSRAPGGDPLESAAAPDAAEQAASPEHAPRSDAAETFATGSPAASGSGAGPAVGGPTALRPEMCVEEAGAQYRVQLRAAGLGQPTLWVTPEVPAQLSFGRRDPATGDELSFALEITVCDVPQSPAEVEVSYRLDGGAADRQQHWRAESAGCAVGRWQSLRVAAAPAPAEGRTAEAVPPESQMPAIPGFWLLRLDAVQDELALSAAQRRRLREIGHEYAEAVKENEAALREAEAQDGNPRVEELRAGQREIAERVRRDVARLLRAEQLQRLADIEFRRRGPAALSRDPILAELRVSPRQKDELAAARRALQSGVRRLRQEAFARDLEVLTEEQMERLKSMYLPGYGASQATAEAVPPDERVSATTPLRERSVP
jgi:beta-lactamase regulating signal transducer with metallopeptidase domain